jgi:2-polyprenyl-3-methyl-5-hydroxy-6-metoxy-1,4-benzoquinol methylase
VQVHEPDVNSGERIRFAVAAAMRSADPGGFDTRVSLETIEHLEHPVGFVDRLVPLLRPRLLAWWATHPLAWQSRA